MAGNESSNPFEYIKIPYIENAGFEIRSYIEAEGIVPEVPYSKKQRDELAERMAQINIYNPYRVDTPIKLSATNHLTIPVDKKLKIGDFYEHAYGDFQATWLGFKLGNHAAHDHSKAEVGLMLISTVGVVEMEAEDYVESFIFTPVDGHSSISLVVPEMLN